MTSNNNVKLNKFAEGLRFPGVFLVGVSSVGSALLLSGESVIIVAIWAFIFALLFILGIALYFNSPFQTPVPGFFGFNISIYAIIFFSLMQYRYPSIAVSLYILGGVLLLLSITRDRRSLRQSWISTKGEKKSALESIASNPDQSGQKVEDKIEVELAAVLQQLQETYAMYQGNKRNTEKALKCEKNSRFTLLLEMLETAEFLEGALKTFTGEETEAIRRIKIKVYQLREKLEANGVSQMIVNVGEYVDLKNKHIVSNYEDSPKNWSASQLPRVKSVKGPGYTVNSELLRRAEVEADWS